MKKRIRTWHLKVKITNLSTRPSLKTRSLVHRATLRRSKTWTTKTKTQAKGTLKTCPSLCEKQDDEEVNLQENAEVEVLRESARGMVVSANIQSLLVRHPLISCKMFRACDKIWTTQTEQRQQNFRVKTDFLEVIPIRPPKPPRILKMAQDVCKERDVWHYIQKGKDSNAPISISD